MFVRWLQKRRQARNKPSRLIRRHLDQTGKKWGFALDDLVSCGYPDWEDVVQRILEINRRYTAEGEPPLGVYKDSARPELEALASELEAQGR